ncbi:MAG: phage late control D family protein [Anaerolineae bacterium]|nr:phage late control D family protein [Anaerolineae bacterium]
MVSQYRYAPEFRIKLGGEVIPALLRASITDVRYTTGLEGADRIELQIANERLRWLDHPLFEPDTPLELEIGYAPDPLTRVFVGEVVSIGATFPSGGMPMLTVAAQDKMHRLQKGTKSRWFAIPIPFVGNMALTDMLVGGLVSVEHGLIPAFDPVGAAIAILVGGAEALALVDGANQVQKLIRRQNGTSDFAFLSQIAAENGWEMVIDHDGPTGGSKLRFFSPLSHISPDVVLKYGASLIDFTPRLSTVGQVAGVTLNLWEPNLKLGFGITIGWDWDRQSLTLSIVPSFGGMVGGAEGLTLVDEPVTKANAARVILSKLIPRLNERLTGSGSTVGDPRIRAGAVLQLEGLGKQFGGYYRVTEATHSLGSGGYTVQFNGRKEPVWFAAIPDEEQGAVPVRLEG